MALSACGESDSGLGSPVDTGPQRPENDVGFTPCGQGIQCATIEVPLDRNEPEGETISIAINRARAGTSFDYKGAVFVNPGGPGAGGKSFLVGANSQLRTLFPGFDLIGFDPRGSGDSSSVDCTASFVATGENPNITGVVSELRGAYELCEQEAGELLQHLGSNEVVQDIDHIREALGFEEINFYGISYGTRLGALYAQTFPTRLRALVLDAPMDPVSDIVGLTEGQFDAFLSLNDKFYDDCASGVLECGREPKVQFERLVDLFTENGRLDDFVVSWQQRIVNRGGRFTNAALLVLVEEAVNRGEDLSPGDPSEMANTMMDEMADEMVDEEAPPTILELINTTVNLTVHCADSSREDFTDEEAQNYLARYEEREDAFGPLGFSGVMCSGWKVDPDPVQDLQFTLDPAPLIVGGLFDGLTPIAFAERMNAALGDSVLLRSGHYGHGAFGRPSVCMRDFMKNYMLYLEMPEVDAICGGG